MFFENVWPTSVWRSVVVPVDAGPAEVEQRLVEHAARRGVQRPRVDGGQDVVDAPVEAQLGQQPVGVLLRGLRLGAHRLVGVHVGEQGSR
jgi:hypothetical protein